jgi:hypothetical protein
VDGERTLVTLVVNEYPKVKTALEAFRMGESLEKDAT